MTEDADAGQKPSPRILKAAQIRAFADRPTRPGCADGAPPFEWLPIAGPPPRPGEALDES